MSDPEKAKDSYKARTAVKYGIPVVGVAFLTSCVDRKQLLDTDDFLLVGNTKAQELSAGKIIGKYFIIFNILMSFFILIYYELNLQLSLGV